MGSQRSNWTRVPADADANADTAVDARTRAASGAHACFLCGERQHVRLDLGARQLLYCKRCALGQLAPLPSEDELDALYASAAYFHGGDRVGYADYAADAAQHARSFRAQLAWLLREGAIRDLLEIGCGPGLLLEEARRLGIARAIGVDPNPWAVAQATARGLDARVGSIASMPPHERFDAIVMLDVLEHVVDPLPFLAAVRRHLRPDGRVLIMTPNIRSLLARCSGRRWVSLKIPEHVRYYSPRAIRLLLGAAGFDVRAVRSAGQYVTLAFLLDRLGRLAPRSAAVFRRIVYGCALQNRVIYVTNGSIDVIAQNRKRDLY